MSQLHSPYASPGKVNVTVTAQALRSQELCNTEVPMVLAQGHVDTVTKLLGVEVNAEVGGCGMGCFVPSWGPQLHPKQLSPEQNRAAPIPWLYGACGCCRLLDQGSCLPAIHTISRAPPLSFWGLDL